MKFKIDGEEYVDLDEVEKLVGMKQTLIYEKMRYDQFPKSEKKKIDITFKRERSLWKKSDIDDYINKTSSENS